MDSWNQQSLNRCEMASLFKRYNGIYYIVSRHERRSVWKSTRTRSQEEAQKVYEEFEREWQKKRRSTVSSFFSKFLQHAPLNYSSQTVRLYSQAFTNFVRILGHKSLPQLSPLDAEEFKLKRSNEVSPVSVNIELRSLKAAFNVAVQWKLIVENPFQNVKQVRVPYKESRHLSSAEFEILLKSVADPNLRGLFKFAVLTMMRLGEIVNLRWPDLDLAGRWIHVRSSGEFRVKGGKPRSVPMSEEVYRLLASRVQVGEYVFSDRVGRKLNPGTISHQFKKAVRKAGLPDSIHFHNLRHTGISWLINKGVPQAFVQRIAGHSSLIVTQVYTHFEDESLKLAINQLN